MDFNNSTQSDLKRWLIGRWWRKYIKRTKTETRKIGICFVFGICHLGKNNRIKWKRKSPIYEMLYVFRKKKSIRTSAIFMKELYVLLASQTVQLSPYSFDWIDDYLSDDSATNKEILANIISLKYFSSVHSAELSNDHHSFCYVNCWTICEKLQLHSWHNIIR